MKYPFRILRKMHVFGTKEIFLFIFLYMPDINLGFNFDFKKCGILDRFFYLKNIRKF